MGDELGSATYIDRLLVSQSSVVYTKFHLDRQRLFLELSYKFSVEMSVNKLKLVRVSFRGYLGENESDYKVHARYIFFVHLNFFSKIGAFNFPESQKCWH